ncbi:LemA family protein [Candidatus Shikimatogenerans silvanidophilus]|uniref:LemA family protein n=1 Tax=Candidatus Shikimatogenerans silvanidophilus TaxID=2782547 RepID=UPI001BA93B87|nr:LemA family protein [Candidatus Shikimatogenerans silvanidophilus]
MSFSLIIYVFFILCFINISLTIYNNILLLNKDLKKQWIKVEKYYKIKNDLINILINDIKLTEKINYKKNYKLINAIEKIYSINNSITFNVYNKLNKEKIEIFKKKQELLKNSLNIFLLIFDKYYYYKYKVKIKKRNKYIQNFYDIKYKIDLTENLINYEIKKFNEKVKKYNLYINKFPIKFFNKILYKYNYYMQI